MKQTIIRKAITAVLLSGAVTFIACSTAWISEVEQIVAVLIPATANLATLGLTLQGSGVSAADLRSIQSASSQAGQALQLMQSLITQYVNADAEARPTLIGQMQDALSTVQSNLNGLLPALHISDTATQEKVKAVVAILVSEVESVAAIIPKGSRSASPEMMAMAARKQHTLNASEFVQSYNAAMIAKTGNAGLDRASARLQIHTHGKFARWASAGLLK